MRRRFPSAVGLVSAASLVLASGCGRTPVEELQDPAVCADCHPAHYEEWSGSMHAYATEDPVFRALNAMGQAETNGELGDFCVQCHAPMAVELGLTDDGLNLDEVPKHLQGVTCYYCHQVEAVEGRHNNPLRLALDRTMRGGIADPAPTPAHTSEASPLHDRNRSDSSNVCGSCHDIVTPLGAHIERTFAEWEGSIFADPQVGLNCGSCHMPGRDGVAVDAEGAPERRVHDHRFPGVDIALTEFPQREDQREQVQAFLDDSLLATLCVEPTEGSTVPILVSLDNVGAGHSFPSGATSDRRVWVEVEAFRGDERVWSSGAVEPGEPLKDHLASDPGVWGLFTEMQTEEGEMTHRFWEAASLEGTSKLLQAHTTLDPRDPAYVQTVQFESYLARGEGIDRVRMAVHIRPLPLDLVDELIADGWLSAAIREEVPTFTLAPTVLEWTPDVPVNSGNLACVPRVPPQR